MRDQRPRHDGDIPRTGQMVLGSIVQTRNIFKRSPRHTKLLGALVHLPDKRLYTAVQVFRKRDRRVVRRGDHNRFKQILQFHLLAFLQIDL